MRYVRTFRSKLGDISKLLTPGLVMHNGVWRDRSPDPLHGLEEVAHVDLPEVDDVETLDLVNLEFSDGTIGRVPRQVGQVRARVSVGQLGNLNKTINKLGDRDRKKGIINSLQSDNDIA